MADGASAALVTADGTVDWYCPGRFDAAAVMSRLVDPSGGALRVGPVRAGSRASRTLPQGSQAYQDSTMVVETRSEGAGGRLRVVDLMPWGGPTAAPPGRLVRIVTALSGPVEVEVELIPPPERGGRPGSATAWSEGILVGGLVVRSGTELLAAPLGRDRPRWRSTRSLDPGESMVVSVDDPDAPAHAPLSVDAAWRLAESTAAAWRYWASTLVADGPYRDAAIRSALLVRALTGVGGAPLAAATTSLPRRVGSERSWDGRLASVHDAAAAAAVLARCGLAEDAEDAERWLRESLEGTSQPWPALLDATGRLPPAAQDLGLPGWRGSQPVVTGAPVAGAPVTGAPDAGARSWVAEHDLYGDVFEAVSSSQLGPWGPGGDGPLAGAPAALAAGADWLADHWEDPDPGVWRSEGPPARLVASAVQSWVALDSAARRAWAADPLDLRAAAWHAEARRVLGWLGGAESPDGLARDDSGRGHTDAALARIAWRGPWPPTHPVVTATLGRIVERLSSAALVLRQSPEVDDGRAGPDNPDLLASLWVVRGLAGIGRWEEAHERMEAVVGLGGRLGILGEAADPATGEILGNLPATAVHLALLDASEALGRGPR